MAIELKVPEVGESVTEVQIGEWHCQEGDTVERDQTLVSIETDKVTVEVSAPAPGRIAKVLMKKGATARVGDVVGILEPGALDTEKPAAPRASSSPPPSRETESPRAESPKGEPAKQETPSREPANPKPALQEVSNRPSSSPDTSGSIAPASRIEPAGTAGQKPWASPAARRALAEHGLRAEDVGSHEAKTRLLREDVERHVTEASGVSRSSSPRDSAGRDNYVDENAWGPAEEVVPMSPFRQRIAQRLVESQQNAALLTTFNEVDMSSVQQIRKDIQASFQEKHGVKLGLMSFFVRAALEALKAIPVVNAEVRGTDIVYKNHYDIGIAVGGGRGLVVPVLRNVERMGFAAIERQIADFGVRAKANKIELHELQGGTFTISNGGVYGSMLSTPIVNPPQSAILGLHAINDRPVARDGQVVIRPMMYVALTYDHRIVDGREAVTFLRTIKEFIEQPVRMLFEV
jgi:2-oxoglutarate dehydrogenase E2 component (dihydrolipoamide succinyltransferase)